MKKEINIFQVTKLEKVYLVEEKEWKKMIRILKKLKVRVEEK